MQQEGRGENGSKGPTNPNTIQWIIRGLDDVVPFITSKSPLLHKAWTHIERAFVSQFWTKKNKGFAYYCKLGKEMRNVVRFLG